MLRFLLFLSLIFVFGVGFTNSLNHSFDSYNYQSIEQIQPNVNLTVNENLDFDVLFNIGGASISESLINDIVQAEQSIEIFMYSFNDPNLFLFLDKVAKSGVEVTIYTDNVKKTFFNSISKMGEFDVSVVYLNKQFTSLEEASYSMHHKAIIIDNKITYWGSNNLTWFQDSFDPGFMIRTTSKEFLQVLSLDLDIIRSGVSGYEKLALRNYNPFLGYINAPDSFYEFWRSPGYKQFSMKDRMVELINNAEYTIDLMSWYITDREIVYSLVNAAKRGVRIRMLLDDFAAQQKDTAINYKSNIFDSFANVEIVYDTKNQSLVDFDMVGDPDFNSFLHFHTLVIDSKELFTSSNNFSRRGFFYNDEFALISNDKFLVESFMEYFVYMRDSLK